MVVLEIFNNWVRKQVHWPETGWSYELHLLSSIWHVLVWNIEIRSLREDLVSHLLHFPFAVELHCGQRWHWFQEDQRWTRMPHSLSLLLLSRWRISPLNGGNWLPLPHGTTTTGSVNRVRMAFMIMPRVTLTMSQICFQRPLISMLVRTSPV